MSIIQCTECESVFDTDTQVDDIALWSEDGRCLCMLCFKEMVEEGLLVHPVQLTMPTRRVFIESMAVGGLIALAIILVVMYL